MSDVHWYFYFSGFNTATVLISCFLHGFTGKKRYYLIALVACGFGLFSTIKAFELL